MKKMMGIFLALNCITLCLSACGTSEENLSSITIDSSYTIVRPVDVNDADLKIFEKFYELMSSKCEGIKVIDDNNIEGVNAGAEILIGDTNRLESKEVIIDSSEKYAIKVVNDKLVIKAGSSLALDAACLYFRERIEKEGLTFPKDYEYNGAYESLEDKYVLVGDQSNGKVTVYDVSKGYVDDTAVWSVSPTYSAGTAGQKVRDTTKYGKVVLCCAGSGVDVFSYPDGENVWTTSYAAEGAHSIDITPDGKILAVASSGSNKVRFFNTDDDTEKFTEERVMDAHGVLYDEKNDYFWVIGKSKLRAFRAVLGSDGTIQVEEMEKYRLPITEAHDLQPYQGDENKLWITGGSGVCVFDKSSGEADTTFKNSETINRMQLKGLSSFRDGSVVFVYPDSEFYVWTSSSFVCSYKLAFAETECFLTLQLPENTHIYKIRAFVSDYTY